MIIVRYGEDHNIHDEWVFNGADIDGSKVIWARELDSQQNAKLFAYFKDRHIWLVEPDVDNTDSCPTLRRPTPINDQIKHSASPMHSYSSGLTSPHWSGV